MKGGELCENIWHIIHDCDDEEGNPTCWASTVNGETIWINETEAGYFEISKDRGIYRRRENK